MTSETSHGLSLWNHLDTTGNDELAVISFVQYSSGVTLPPPPAQVTGVARQVQLFNSFVDLCSEHCIYVLHSLPDNFLSGGPSVEVAVETEGFFRWKASMVDGSLRIVYEAEDKPPVPAPVNLPGLILNLTIPIFATDPPFNAAYNAPPGWHGGMAIAGLEPLKLNPAQPCSDYRFYFSRNVVGWLDPVVPQPMLWIKAADEDSLSLVDGFLTAAGFVEI